MVHVPCLAVIVVNFGSHELVEANVGDLVPALADALPGSFAVIVDNFSTATERAAIRELCSREGWRVELPSENRGFGGGVNLGVARARREGARLFLLLNPDASISAVDVGVLAGRVAAEPRTLVSPKIVRPDGRTWFSGSDLLLRTGRLRSAGAAPPDSDDPAVPWLTGACLMISDELWQEVGGLDEDYFLYWEDVDLSWRVAAAGGGLAVVSECVAVHDEGGTHQDRAPAARKSDLYYYYNIRNRLLFAGKNLDSTGQRRWVRATPQESWQILLRGGRRQFLTSTGPLAAAVRGCWDGLSLIRSSAAPRR